MYNGKRISTVKDGQVTGTKGGWEHADGTRYSEDWLLELDTEAKRTARGITEYVPLVRVPTLDQMHQAKLADINSAFADDMAKVKDGYPADEVMSWAKQESDSRAYLADQNADTKLLDSLAATRNMPKNLFAQKIIDKADQYAVVVGQLIGKRQILEDQAKAIYDDTNKDEATKRAELALISW